MLPFYADYFGIKYPLSKLDLIAIADFGAGKNQIFRIVNRIIGKTNRLGAMENWGFVRNN